MKRAIAMAALLVAFVALGLGGVAFLRWWRAYALVPDSAAPFVATFPFKFAATGTLTQRVRPRFQGLARVELILVAENPDLPGDLRLVVSDAANGSAVRTASGPAAGAPAGDAWAFRPGQAGERWFAFSFEPIGDSAGRDLSLAFSYPDGRDTPGQRFSALARQSGSHGLGSLQVNGSPVEGNLLFRLSDAGTHAQAVRVAWDNLVREQPIDARAVPAALLAGVGSLLFAAAVCAVTFMRHD